MKRTIEVGDRVRLRSVGVFGQVGVVVGFGGMGGYNVQWPNTATWACHCYPAADLEVVEPEPVKSAVELATAEYHKKRKAYKVLRCLTDGKKAQRDALNREIDEIGRQHQLAFQEREAAFKAFLKALDDQEDK